MKPITKVSTEDFNYWKAQNGYSKARFQQEVFNRYLGDKQNETINAVNQLIEREIVK
jgi:hypothetical protein